MRVPVNMLSQLFIFRNSVRQRSLHISGIGLTAERIRMMIAIIFVLAAIPLGVFTSGGMPTYRIIVPARDSDAALSDKVFPKCTDVDDSDTLSANLFSVFSSVFLFLASNCPSILNFRIRYILGKSLSCSIFFIRVWFVLLANRSIRRGSPYAD